MCFSFRQNGSPDLTYADFIIVQSVWGMTQGVFMPLSGFISRLIGARCAMLLGCFIFSSGAALTYFTLDMGLVSYMIIDQHPQCSDNQWHRNPLDP